jgi:type IV pilus assembly protein PilX
MRAPRAHPATTIDRLARMRGVVLLVALLTSLALASAAMALLRASATVQSVASAVHARRQATFAASAAVEQAIVVLFRDRLVDLRQDDVPRNYFASQQAAEDARGVPRALQSIAAYPADAPILEVPGGLHVRHVVERMCAAAGDAAPGNCTLSPPSLAAARGTPPPGEPPRQPSYRVSARVDGPAGSATFVQAILSPAHVNPRLSWRILDE